MTLKVFYNDADYVIARDKSQATEIWEKYTKEEWDNFSEWKELRPTKKLKGAYRFVHDDVREIWTSRARNSGVVVKSFLGTDLEVESPLSEWIEVYGEGWLMSTER